MITAKQKIDATRRARYETGGGPAPPELTRGEEAMAATLEGRPGIHGIVGGVDTDGRCNINPIKSSSELRCCSSYGFPCVRTERLSPSH